MRIFRFIEDALRETVFEPNDPDLWHRITATLSLFLRDLFYAGDLGGRTEQEAFFVKCDGETNTPETIDQGRVLALLGFQATLPAEFIVVRINRASDAATSFEISS